MVVSKTIVLDAHALNPGDVRWEPLQPDEQAACADCALNFVNEVSHSFET